MELSAAIIYDQTYGLLLRTGRLTARGQSMPWLRNDIVGSSLIAGAALVASIALAVAARLDVLPPLFDPQQPVLLAAVIIGLSIITSGVISVTLGFYLVQAAAVHEMRARLDFIYSLLKDAEAMLECRSDTMVGTGVGHSGGLGEEGDARSPAGDC